MPFTPTNNCSPPIFAVTMAASTREKRRPLACRQAADSRRLWRMVCCPLAHWVLVATGQRNPRVLAPAVLPASRWPACNSQAALSLLLAALA